MKIDNLYFSEIKEMLDQFKTAVKRLEDQGVDVSSLKKEINSISDKISHPISDRNEEVLNHIRKEALAECMFIRKKITDTIRKQIRDIIENEINIS